MQLSSITFFFFFVSPFAPCPVVVPLPLPLLLTPFPFPFPPVHLVCRGPRWICIGWRLWGNIALEDEGRQEKAFVHARFAMSIHR
jgi:hypothetical protein